ncbi:serine/threonine protein kinase [Amycolatopsis sp. NPDC049868]|uniref:serine/threonine protein kinase n=1 Tax=Amycolatopsis sp. NPDC049868 TaxID=3363934 RepID=UPI0037A56EA9
MTGNLFGVPLGIGPVATVYPATYAGVPVAMKVFPARLDRATLSAVERDRDRLRAVASALPVDGVDQLPDGRHALRMERCTHSLATLLGQVGRLSTADAVVLGHTVATCLATAHAAGVVHGGVHPANVLFRTTGEPVLADFGVALRQAFPRDPARSLEYLAPETLRTETFDERTDLYGLGMVLYLALTGDHPQPGRLGEPMGERLLRLLRTPVPPIDRPGVPVILSAMVSRLLAPDPAHRPPDAAWVADRLAEMFPRPEEPDWPPPSNEREDAVPPAPAEARRAVRVRLGVVFGAAAALAVLGAVAVVLLGDRRPEVVTTTPAATGEPEQVADLELELAEPTDRGNHVMLAWTSSSGSVDYAVIVAPENEPNRTVLAGRAHAITIPVDPVRRYCFEVQATDSRVIHTSPPKPIRGAVCRP